MGLASGTKLGPYEILSLLGAGGMGEVYRAHDSRLDREVAIKLLPASLAADPSSRQRLEREAKAVSKLSHPHICALHDIGQQDGVDYLVMELVEGETLEQRLLKGPLPPERTISYGAQIADALAKAHKLGFAHRDLKPANIMLAKSGAKLMDFGLAKQTVAVAEATSLTAMTSDQSKLTGHGVLVGTFQYMAPEQLEGKEADARTDIFALGEVLYEMATGKPAFSGKSRATLIASILTAEPPPISKAQPLTPVALERVVKKCLAKDPDERWQSASDLASELRWIAESGSQSTALVPPPAGFLDRMRRRSLLPWALLACLLAATGALAWRQLLAKKTGQAVTHVTVSLPANLSFGSPVWPLFALSRDGTKLVFSEGVDQRTQLYVRQMDQWDATAIKGTEGGDRPFFSPDGQWVAFNSGRNLKKVAITGGPAVDLAETNWGGGSWGPNDKIVYTRSYNAGLWMVGASGGTPQMLTSPDHAKGELADFWPQILPDGDSVLFTRYSTPIERSRIFVRSLKTGKEKLLIEGGTFARYLAPGYLLFSKGATVLAVPLDVRKLELTGSPVPVLEGVASFPQNDVAQFAVSENGTVAFLPSSFITTEAKLISVDRKGKVQTIREHLQVHGGMRLSADGKKIALGLGEAGHPPDVWIDDLDRGLLSRLTRGPGSNFNPIWTPDGKQIFYTSERPVFDIYRKSTDGSGTEEPVLTTANDKYPLSISSDGKTLLFSTSDPVTLQDLWVTALAETKSAKPFIATQFSESSGRISPDGRWVAYQSNESAQTEIYVTGFPNGEGRVQVSTDGGSEPVWSRNGKELFYRKEKKLIAVPVQNGNTFTMGPPQVLFESTFATNSAFGSPLYDVSPDGQKFYFIQDATKDNREPRLNLILNWPEELKRIAPANSGR
jgi:Tol biopolymer transport system component